MAAQEAYSQQLDPAPRILPCDTPVQASSSEESSASEQPDLPVSNQNAVVSTSSSFIAQRVRDSLGVSDYPAQVDEAEGGSYEVQTEESQTCQNADASEGLLDGAEQGISLKVVYHEPRRSGFRPVRFDLPGLASTSTIEEVAALASQHKSRSQTPPSNGPTSAPPLRLFYLGVELYSRDTLDECGIDSGGIVTVVPGTPQKTLRVTELVPSSGSETGGNSVHISGQCFRTSVERPLLARFGATVVPTVPVSGEGVRCTSPPHPPGPVSVEVSSDGGHTWTSNNVTYTYIGLRTVLDHPIRVPSVHCSAMSTVQELERAALRHSRGF